MGTMWLHVQNYMVTCTELWALCSYIYVTVWLHVRNYGHYALTWWAILLVYSYPYHHTHVSNRFHDDAGSSSLMVLFYIQSTINGSILMQLMQLTPIIENRLEKSSHSLLPHSVVLLRLETFQSRMKEQNTWLECGRPWTRHLPSVFLLHSSRKKNEAGEVDEVQRG